MYIVTACTTPCNLQFTSRFLFLFGHKEFFCLHLSEILNVKRGVLGHALLPRFCVVQTCKNPRQAWMICKACLNNQLP